MGKSGYRESNPNWRGGRGVTEHGYVIVRVGIGHPLADVRGYAYEHRVVATEKIGRSLRRGEHVHHIDGNRQNNNQANLEVLSCKAHRCAHRKQGGKRIRMPGERNPVVRCACGCGTRFRRYDTSNRMRRYVPGHNPPRAPTRDAIIAALRAGPMQRIDILARLCKPANAVVQCLSKLTKAGVLVRPDRAVYALAARPRTEVPHA